MQPRKARVQASYQNYQWEKQHWKGRGNPHTGQDTEKLTLNRDTAKTCPRWHVNVLPQPSEDLSFWHQASSVWALQPVPRAAGTGHLSRSGLTVAACPPCCFHPPLSHCSLCASGIPGLIAITTPFTPCKHRGSPKSLHFSETVTYSYNHLCMHMLACEVIKTIKIRICKHQHWSLHCCFNTPPPH